MKKRIMDLKFNEKFSFGKNTPIYTMGNMNSETGEEFGQFYYWSEKRYYKKRSIKRQRLVFTYSN